MVIESRDIVPFGQARSRLTELATDVRQGAEKIITKNGEAYVALVDARHLDHYHRLEREHIHLVLLGEAERGLQDIEEERLLSVGELRAEYGR